MKNKSANHRNTGPGRAATRPGKMVPLLCMILLCASAAWAQVNVLTYHNDNLRTGQNQQETILTPANVNTNQFVKLFSALVNGQIYAQPLYVSNLNIAGGVHNVVFAATEGDDVYAFDADNGAQLWGVSVIDPAHGGAPGATTASSNDVSCGDISPQYGISATPAIDLGSNTMYVEAKSNENGIFVHRLHALDITTGNEKFPGPVVIAATVAGTGLDSVNGMISFNALRQHGRPGLLLMNGVVYIGFASHCDGPPQYPPVGAFMYHGWVFSYDTATFTQQGVFITTPNFNVTRPPVVDPVVPEAAGIWMAGAGLAGDGASVFMATGNGDFDNASVPPSDVGDSIIRLNGGSLGLSDWFTPTNQSNLNACDADLGSGGVLLLPDEVGTTAHPHLLIHTGKEGTIRLIDRDQMGQYIGPQQEVTGCGSVQPQDSQIVQELVSVVGGMWSMPAYWNGNVYFWGVGDTLKAYSFNNGLLSFLGTSTDTYGYPGATPSVSANGNGNGIVWSLKTDAAGSGPAVLRAHDALGFNLLYSSDQNSADNPGTAIKFTVPTIANGKVYVGTDGLLSVFGPGSRSPNQQHVNHLLFNGSAWINQDLTAFTGGPLAASGSGLGSFTDGAGEHAYYAGVDQHLHQLYFNSSWVDQDLTAATGGQAALSGSGISSFADGSGEHAYYVGADQHLHQLYFSSSWVDQDLTAATGGQAVATASGVSSFADGAGEHAYYVGVDQHLHQLVFSSSWVDQDLTAATGGPAAATGSGISGFADGAGEHVYYVGVDQHLHQLYFNSSWVDQDLTAFTGGPAVGTGSGVGSFADGAGEHAYYVGADQHLHQLYFSSSWVDQDLTAFTGGPAVATASGVSSFADGAGEHVYYQSQ